MHINTFTIGIPCAYEPYHAIQKKMDIDFMEGASNCSKPAGQQREI